MREAVKRYFEENGFGADGGYASPWVDFKLGPIPFPLPNTASRVRAVRFHDLHHVLTGYRTDIVGEFEISAWELAAGCKDFHAAWVLNLSGIAGGLLRSPVRTFKRLRPRPPRAHQLRHGLRGALLDRSVEDLRRELEIGDAAHPARIGRRAALRLFAVAGLVVGLLLMVVLLSPVTFGALVARTRGEGGAPVVAGG